MPTRPYCAMKIEVSEHNREGLCVLHVLGIRRRQRCLVLFGAQKIDDVDLTILFNKVSEMTIKRVL